MAKNDITKSSKDKSKKAAVATKKKGGLRRWFRELKSELKKVVWPTRKKVINNSGIVITVMTVFGLFLGALDLGLGFLIRDVLLKIGS